MNKSILSMKDIRKTFSGVAVLDEVELNLNENKLNGIMKNANKLYDSKDNNIPDKIIYIIRNKNPIDK